jgi:beta-xylosidase
MYLTVVPGIFEDWKHPRNIHHFKSKDLVNWQHVSQLELASNKVIDACVFQVSDNLWRLWYNNEKDRKTTYFAESTDLYNWIDKGKANLIGKQRGEGPDVFTWNEKYYMIIDEWSGLGIFSSNDALNWKRQDERILDIPGKGKQDNVIGQHADVLRNKDKAYVIYFTHPGRSNPDNSPYLKARSVLQIAELEILNQKIVCNRDKDLYINLSKPKK